MNNLEDNATWVPAAPWMLVPVSTQPDPVLAESHCPWLVASSRSCDRECDTSLPGFHANYSTMLDFNTLCQQLANFGKLYMAMWTFSWSHWLHLMQKQPAVRDDHAWVLVYLCHIVHRYWNPVVIKMMPGNHIFDMTVCDPFSKWNRIFSWLPKGWSTTPGHKRGE